MVAFAVAKLVNFGICANRDAGAAITRRHSNFKVKFFISFVLVAGMDMWSLEIFM
jgi:hypothetical protein